MSNSSKDYDLLRSAAQGRLTHCVLLTGPREKTSALAVSLAAAVLCPEHRPDGCECRICRRIREGILPDVSVIDRGDSAVPVDTIRAMRSDAFVAPLEASGKVFIIKNAHNMNGAAQNAALKLFEEPPTGVFFILTADRADMLLQTVRSRCLSVYLGGREEEENGASAAAREQAMAFAQALVKDDESALFLACLELEKLKKAEAAAFFDEALTLVRASLRAAGGAGAEGEYPPLTALGTRSLMRIAQILLKRRRAADANIGVAHLMGTIAPEYYGD